MCERERVYVGMCVCICGYVWEREGVYVGMCECVYVGMCGILVNDEDLD